MDVEDARFIYQDLGACWLALANALEAKGLLTKPDIAAAAQERLLVLRERLPKEAAERLVLLHSLATEFERVPGDIPKPD